MFALFKWTKEGSFIQIFLIIALLISSRYLFDRLTTKQSTARIAFLLPWEDPCISMLIWQGSEHPRHKNATFAVLLTHDWIQKSFWTSESRYCIPHIKINYLFFKAWEKIFKILVPSLKLNFIPTNQFKILS